MACQEVDHPTAIYI